MNGKSDVVCLKNLADLVVNSSCLEKTEKGLSKRVGKNNQYYYEIKPLQHKINDSRK